MIRLIWNEILSFICFRSGELAIQNELIALNLTKSTLFYRCILSTLPWNLIFEINFRAFCIHPHKTICLSGFVGTDFMA